jgi:hypothetical protein
VLDIRMTGMSGTEVLEKLKVIQPSIEVIMLTAYETVDTIRQALRLGACDYLNKPFDVATIRKAVATAMERHSFADEIRANNERLAALQVELHDQKLQEEITRTRGEIYASIIHDINGPLTIISGFIQIINQRMGDSKRLEGEDMEMVKDRLRRITRQVSNCIEISHRYLSFMRQQPAAPIRINVNLILDDLRELLNVHPSKGQNTLKIHALVHDIELQINGTDLIQILLNLAINALQCSPNRIWWIFPARSWKRAWTFPTCKTRLRTGFFTDKDFPTRRRCCNCRSATTAPAYRRMCCRRFFSLISPPRRRAKAPAWGWPLSIGCSRKRAAACTSIPKRAKAPPLTSTCRPHQAISTFIWECKSKIGR